MQKAFFDALRNGRAKQAAQLLSERLIKDSAPASLIESVRLIQEDLEDKLSPACPTEERQRIEEFYAAKVLDVWDQFEKTSQRPPSPKHLADRLVKGVLLLVVLSLVLMLIEIVTW